MYQNHRLLHLAPREGLPRCIFSFAILNFLIMRDALTLLGEAYITRWGPKDVMAHTQPSHTQTLPLNKESDKSKGD